MALQNNLLHFLNLSVKIQLFPDLNTMYVLRKSWNYAWRVFQTPLFSCYAYNLVQFIHLQHFESSGHRLCFFSEQVSPMHYIRHVTLDLSKTTVAKRSPTVQDLIQRFNEVSAAL